MATYASKLKSFNIMRLEKSMVDEQPQLKLLFNGTSPEDICLALNTALVEANEKQNSVYSADPATSAWLRYGFARAMDALPFLELEWEDDSTFDPNDTVFIPLTDGSIFCVVERRDRILPGDTLRDAVAKEGAKLADRKGEALNKREWAEIRDTVAARLLSSALVRNKQIPIIMKPSRRDKDVWDVVYFTSSAKIIEDINAYLFRSILGSYPIRHLEDDLLAPVTLLLTKILTDDSPELPWPYFFPGTSAKMVSPHGGGAEYSFKDQALRDADGVFDPLVAEAIGQKYRVANMAMKFYDKSPVDYPQHYVTLKLNAKGVFSGLKISDVLTAEQGSPDDDSALLDFYAFTYLLNDVTAGLAARLEEIAEHYYPDGADEDDVDGSGTLTEEDENDQL